MFCYWFAVVLIGIVGANANLYCYEDVKSECASKTYAPVCSTTFGNFPNVVNKFQQFANTHLARSWQTLLVGKQFSNYQKMRPGFHDLFVKVSGSYFDQFVALMRYINDRGSTHNFGNQHLHDETQGNYELFELQSLSWLTDVQKKLAQDAIDLGALVGGSDPRYHDADASYRLQTKFAYRHRKNVRDFASFYVKLEKMSTSKNQKLVLYDFDNFLISG